MIRIQSDDGAITCVTIGGVFRASERLQADGALDEVLENSPPGRTILLDLSGLQAIDSSGLCWLLRQQRRIRERGGQLVLHSASPTLDQTLNRLKLGLVFRIAPDRQSAMRLAQTRERAFDSGIGAFSDNAASPAART